jgi:hypothetical protein
VVFFSAAAGTGIFTLRARIFFAFRAKEKYTAL